MEDTLSTLSRESKTLSAEANEARQMQYGVSPEQRFGVAYGAQSTKPLNELYQEASVLKQSIEDKGYISRADERRAEYLTAVVQERLQAAEEGTYSLSEQAARAASLTQMIGETIQHSYQRRRSGNQWYQ